MNRPLVWIAFFLIASPLYAQKVGDRVIVVAPVEAKLKVDSRVVDAIPRGVGLTIEEISDRGFRVHCKGQSGWISKTDVVPLDDAIALFGRAIAKEPHACDYLGRGNSWYGKGKNEKAIADYTAAIRLDPKCVWAYWDRAGAYVIKGNLDRAIADLTKAIGLDPEIRRRLLRPRLRLHPKRRPRQSHRGLHGSRPIERQRPCDLSWAGRVYDRKGDHEKASADFAEAARLSPKRAKGPWRAYYAHGASGDYSDAIADCSEAIRLNPKDADLYYARVPSTNTRAMRTRPSRTIPKPFGSIRSSPTPTGVGPRLRGQG